MKHELEKVADGFGWSAWKCKKCGMRTMKLFGRFLKWHYQECEVDCIKRNECMLFVGNDHCNLKHLCQDFNYKHFEPKEAELL